MKYREVCSILFVLVVPAVIVASSSSEPGTNTIFSIVKKIESWKQHYEKSEAVDKPFVTLTYAQSIDGNIALIINDTTDGEKPQTSSNFPLSDPESLRMTHALRATHDAILIGGRTLAVDNPRLSNRLWDSERREIRDMPKNPQPRPVVLDTHLNYMRSLGNSCRASNVIACCSYEAAIEATSDHEHRNTAVFPSGLELLPCPVNPSTGRLYLRDVLKRLKQVYGIQSIMVEGGASVLRAFYREQDLIDCLCITIAPKLLLWNGLPAVRSTGESQGIDLPSSVQIFIDADKMISSEFFLLGSDAIFICKLDLEAR